MSSASKPQKPRRFLSRQDQAERYGVSVKSITRWGQDPKMGMPSEYPFNRTPKRREDELEIWERGLAATVAAK